jgi:hypothetical protein
MNTNSSRLGSKSSSYRHSTIRMRSGSSTPSVSVTISLEKVDEDGMSMERQDITHRTEAKERGVNMIRAQWFNCREYVGELRENELSPGAARLMSLREMEGTDVIEDEVITVDPSQLLKHLFNFYIA